MVTANLNHERQTSADVESGDDESNNQQLQTRLDRLYMEPSQSGYPPHPYSQRASSPANSRDMYMNSNSNTVPVYRHGRKFYVSIEEFERMRAEERRHRRTQLQRAQHLPVSKSYQTNVRSPSASLFNPVQRSTSHPHDQRYGVLRAPHLPMNSTVYNNNNTSNDDKTRYHSTRPSRSTSRHDDDRDNLSIVSALPMKLSTNAIRSNSSDKVLDLRKTPQPSVSSYNGYVPDDCDLKRSFSEEIVQPTTLFQTQQPQVAPRRVIPNTSAEYISTTGSSFPVTSTVQTYNQSNASKLTSYFNRMQSSTLNSPTRQPVSSFASTDSTFATNMQDSDHVYSVLGSSNRRSGDGLTPTLMRSTSTHSNHEYYFQGPTSGSLSDDNSSSTSMLIQRRNTDANRYRPPQFIGETDHAYDQQNEVWTRSTARSHSSDGLTEKKRVRFADMEGFTLETVPDIEQQRSPRSNRLLVRRPHDQLSNNVRGQIQPFQNSFYQTSSRTSGKGSKLATDV